MKCAAVNDLVEQAAAELLKAGKIMAPIIQKAGQDMAAAMDERNKANRRLTHRDKSG